MPTSRPCRAQQAAGRLSPIWASRSDRSIGCSRGKIDGSWDVCAGLDWMRLREAFALPPQDEPRLPESAGVPGMQWRKRLEEEGGKAHEILCPLRQYE